VTFVTLLVASHPAYLEHDTGPWHPERPARLDAVAHGIEAAGLGPEVVQFSPRPATPAEVAAVHPGGYLDRIQAFTAAGGGSLDADTTASSGSYAAALLAAGAGLDAVERLDRGEGDAAFCAIRPPGHHATPRRPMGFCLVNNVAVCAASLVARGERVLVVDYDAHHGNGTQDVFYGDDRVVFVSIHEYPLYPGTGALEESGAGAGRGATVNVPVPAGATGDVYRDAVDKVVAPIAAAFCPTWLLVSAGFDAHRADPLTGLALSAGDFGDLAAAVAELVPPGRRVFFLEGGYDLQAVADGAGATAAALVGSRHRPERATAGGPGRTVVDAVVRYRAAEGWA